MGMISKTGYVRVESEKFRYSTRAKKKETPWRIRGDREFLRTSVR